jgi:signal transduction histidine kinase
VTSLGKLFRATAFKLSFAYLVIFALFAFFVLRYVAWNASRVLDQQIVSVIEAEINGLREQYRLGSLWRLMSAIERRSLQPGASLYLLTDSRGIKLAGNVGELPPGVLDRPGQRETLYGRADETEVGRHKAIVRVFVLENGARLLVGRDIEERVRLNNIIRQALGWSLLLVGVLGCLGGWFVTRRVLARVDAMTATTRTIMAGDLGGRVPVAGTGDELDRLAQNLNAMLDRIGELLAGFRQVSDNIAHDLKTPLTRLRNRADEALRSETSPEGLRAALEDAIEESDNLIRVFNALLMIARLEAGLSPEAMAEVDAAAIAEDVAELYEAAAEEAGYDLRVVTSGPVRLNGNRELLGQAIANLVDNALKYGSPAEPGRMEPSVEIRVERQGSEAAISVADRGAGIPEGERGRVLERFVRLEGARTRPGFGLGLSLAAAVARLHEGSIRLEDNAPGLRVVLLLPALPVLDLPRTKIAAPEERAA